MQFQLKNPYKILPQSGYTMVGKSNQFKKHINKFGDNPFRWFHCFVDHDNNTVKIHIDRAKNQRTIQLAYKHHKTTQKSWEIDDEIKRIKGYEPKWWQFWKK